jgi:hypothetical protein
MKGLQMSMAGEIMFIIVFKNVNERRTIGYMRGIDVQTQT